MAAWLDAPRILSRVAHDPATPERAGGFLAAALLLAGAGAGALSVGRLLRPARRRLEEAGGNGPAARVVPWTGRTLAELLPIVLFYGTGHVLVAASGVGEPARAASVAALLAASGVALALALGRAAFAPRADTLRLLPLSDETAAYGQLWVRRLAWFGGGGAGILGAAAVAGWSGPGHDLAAKIFAALIAALVIALLRQLRDPVASLLAGDGAEPGRLARTWHVPAALYVAALAAAWILELAAAKDIVLRGLVASGLSVGAALLVDRGAALLLLRLLGPRGVIAAAGVEARAGRYLWGVHALMRTLVWLIAAFALLQVWGPAAPAWLDGAGGRGAVAGIVRVLAFALAALVLVEVVQGVLAGALERAAADGSSKEPPRRLRTLLPLAAAAMRVAALAVVALVALAEMGVNIGPLLAGAGVLGIAVGFGAQKLVQDVIAGLFILIEDSVAVGDVVRVTGHSGVVETLSLRAMTLRDLSGAVHTIPFSTVDTLENMTKDFSYALVDVGVGYREDTDRVMDVLEEVAEAIRADGAFTADILDPLEILGVQELADSAVVIRARLRTVSGRQWAVRREYLRRVKHAFDERGIEIPFPHLTVFQGDPGAGPSSAAGADDRPAPRIRSGAAAPDHDG